MKPFKIVSKPKKEPKSKPSSTALVPIVNKAPPLSIQNVEKRQMEMVQRGRFVLNEALKSLYRGFVTDDCNDRDMDHEFKYPSKPYTIEDYKWWYQYNGLAKRIVEIQAQECFKRTPEIWEKDTVSKTPFENGVIEFIEKFNFWSLFLKMDIARGIGEFGGFFLGWNDLEEEEELDTPAAVFDRYGNAVGPRKPGMQLRYLRVFDQSQVTIEEWDDDPMSDRNGKPTLYSIKFGRNGQDDTEGGETLMVHWTRFWHSADNLQSSVSLGHPRLEPVLEYVYDVKKVAGGSGEMYWRAAMPGYSFETQEGMMKDGMPEIDTDSVAEQIKLFTDGFQRFVATVGMTANSLAPQVTKPNDHVTQYLQLIALTIRVPHSKLIGMESGHLAASNDDKTMDDASTERCTRDLNPEIIAFMQYMVTMKQIAANKKPIKVTWPTDGYDAKRAETSLKMIQGLVQYMTSNAAKVVPPLVLLMDFFGYSEERATDILEKAKTWLKENKDFLPPEPVPTTAVGGNQKGKAKKKATGRPKGKLEKT